MSKNLTLSRIQKKSTERYPEIMNKSDVPANQLDMYNAMALAGEVGEFCNLLKKIKRGSRKLDDKTRKEIAHELADAQLYLVACASSLDIELADAVVEKFNLVSKKYSCEIML